MIRKTYGVSGLMDWTTNIKVGKASVSVHFTGGALTAYGVTPAKYSTANPFFQNVIEGSEYYKSGRIQLLEQMEVPDDAATIERKQRSARLAAAKAKTSPDVGKVEVGTEAEAVQVTTKKEQPVEAADAPATVEVADKNDAIEYLKENYNPNYTATQLRTKSAFEAACKICGVKFVFTA